MQIQILWNIWGAHASRVLALASSPIANFADLISSIGDFIRHQAFLVATYIPCHPCNQWLGFFFGTVWNDGSDSSIITQGNLSSRKIAFCGANGVGSSSDAIVTSMLSESLLSSKNKCVPQHAANERIRFAYGILRDSPFVTTKSLRGIVPQITIRRTGAFLAINAMTIDHGQGPTLQHVSCPAANASTS